ncbi:DUF222 domain-containing protein [Arthrobacter sp. STN4]|uniref:DUF222 domain-containing protein n=1 Tax=Arthrobacter sp. STN4 TaxID=2923276 RepID=UPI002119F13E|nr:DUF222 domain-containing protein [Arthrobacter sp. STN4]
MWRSPCAIAEVAVTLCLPETTAKALAAQARDLVGARPQVMAALRAGTLSWRHACTIPDETGTLAGTQDIMAADVDAFEAALLAVAPGTTGARFAAKARRLREGTHPESLTVRTREAISKKVPRGRGRTGWPG